MEIGWEGEGRGIIDLRTCYGTSTLPGGLGDTETKLEKVRESPAKYREHGRARHWGETPWVRPGRAGPRSCTRYLPAPSGGGPGNPASSLTGRVVCEAIGWDGRRPQYLAPAACPRQGTRYSVPASTLFAPGRWTATWALREITGVISTVKRWLHHSARLPQASLVWRVWFVPQR